MSHATLQPIDSAISPRFAEPATFMRTPYLRSYARLDIALVGVPFDLGSTNRAGARHGPAQIREMSRLIRKVNASSRIAPFELCNVADIGDAPQNPLDLMASVNAIAAFYAELHAAGVVPVSAGGDHTVTYPILQGIVDDGRPLGVVHFDAHADTLDSLLGSRVNHATVFRRAVEEGLIEPQRTIQIGLRGTRYSDEDIQYGYDAGMRIVTMDDYERMGRDKVIKEIRRVVGGGPTYVTFDIDGLDPVYCIGTGAPEPGGLSMRDAQVMLRGLQGLHLVGGDVCEVSPPLDPTGHTALNGANLMFEILCVVADSVARHKRKAAKKARKAEKAQAEETARAARKKAAKASKANKARRADHDEADAPPPQTPGATTAGQRRTASPAARAESGKRARSAPARAAAAVRPSRAVKAKTST